jgi:cation diffusion facilitator CzcD-associated flavoprotein CzcO
MSCFQRSAYLGEDYDVETHFSPKYRPWRQRVAFIPDGDLFQEIRSKRASVVTDEIERFTPSGILTKSGKLIEADIVVTATGFNLNVLGDIDFVIDGQPLCFSDTITYRGTMFVGCRTWRGCSAIFARAGRCASTWLAISSAGFSTT